MRGDNVIDGNKLWSDFKFPDLVSREINDGNYVETYRGIPDNLYEMLCRTASLYPDKTAIVDNYDRSYTYRDLLDMTDRLASFLYYERGVRRVSHVALLLYCSMEFCTAFFALAKLGAVTVPLPTKYRKNEILSLVDKADLELIICEEEFRHWFEEREPEKRREILAVPDAGKGYGFGSLAAKEQMPVECLARYDDQALIVFTSGTTSQSKGAVIRNYNIMHAIVSYQVILKITQEDKTIIPIPIYHITGLVALLGLFVYVGGTIYLHKAFSAKRVLECVRQNGITFLHAAPTVFSLLLQQREQFPSLPSLKSFACGSSNMPKELLRRIYDWIPQIEFHTVYGLTETTSPAAIFPYNVITSPHIGSSGWPIPGTQFRIVDESGAELPAGQVGEILVRGAVVIQNYYKLQSDLINGDGWLRTGDMGYFDEENFLYVVDRKKDMINRGGEKIWCFDVENELYRIDGILEAAVVAIPHEIYGEVAGAVVRLKEGSGLDEESIKKELAENLARYKVPERILVLDAVPQTPNGKIDKKEIRKLFSKGSM